MIFQTISSTLLTKLNNIFETITGGVTNINSDHALIHDGYGFVVSDYITLTNGATKNYCLTAPESLYVHFKNLNIGVIGDSVKVEIFRNTDVTTNTGTAVNLRNTNDNSTYTADTTIKEDPTINSVGDLWRDAYALTDTTNQTTGQASITSNENQELVTKNANTEYIIRFTNLGTNSVNVFWEAFLYEETQGLSS